MLSKLLYYIIIIPLSLLPFRLLYIISDFLYIVIYYIAGYRKKVVIKNIQNSFPEKSPAEQTTIIKGFYRHMCDLIVESLKIFTITGKNARQRMKLLNPEFIQQYYNEGKSIIMAGGHLNNWELFAV